MLGEVTRSRSLREVSGLTCSITIYTSELQCKFTIKNLLIELKIPVITISNFVNVFYVSKTKLNVFVKFRQLKTFSFSLEL